MNAQQESNTQETELQPTSGWVGVGLIAIILVAAGIAGNGDYVTALESERDELRDRIAHMEAKGQVRDVCWQNVASPEVAP